MKQHRGILIKQSFEKADEALLSAKVNIDNDFVQKIKEYVSNLDV